MVTCGDSFLVRQSQGTEVNNISSPAFHPIQNFSQAVLKIGKVPVNKGIQSKEDEKDIKESSHISCSAVCPNSNLLALCDESKQVTLWKLPEAELISQRNLQRRATRALFTQDSKGLLVADKSGDVYLFSTEKEKEGELLLGHLSMLLDLRITLDSKFVITADRDEKIRVSNFPNSYNIHNYCLGHGDFVTSLGILSEDLLLSGSGDGTVRVWRFLEGTEVARREVCHDIDQESVNGSNGAAEEKKVEEKNDRRVAAPSQAAVVSVLCLRSSLFLVQVIQYPWCICFTCSRNHSYYCKTYPTHSGEVNIFSGGELFWASPLWVEFWDVGEQGRDQPEADDPNHL